MSMVRRAHPVRISLCPPRLADNAIDGAQAGRDTRCVSEESSLAAGWARALAGKDPDRMAELLAPEIDFRAMTPNRTWEASDPQAVLAIVFGHWFEDADEIRALEGLETDAFADRQRVGYRLRVSNPEGGFLVEQQAYLSEQDGQIAWMRVLCSGYRPAA